MLNGSVPTFGTIIFEMEHLLSELEQLAGQAAVHRKKFEFGVNQFRRFLIAFSSSVSPSNMNSQLMASQFVDYHKLCNTLRELYQLLCQHQIHNWAHPTLENECSSVASALTSIATRLQQASQSLNPKASQLFNGDCPQWLQYHLLDLRGIAASFNQYLKSAQPGDGAVPLMTDRLKSVNEFLQKYENETIPAGIRVFSPIPVNYQSWRLNHDDLQEIKEIGSGISANVFYGFYKPNGKEVAIKKLKFKKLSGSKLQAFQREVGVLAAVSHPCILGFVGATDTPPFCIVTEWISGGNLYQEIHKYKRLNPTMRSIVAFDIARGMQFLHSKHIIHRDLKSLNVLLDSTGKAKICDFGFSKQISSQEDKLMTQNIGTPQWMAPELLSASPTYDSKVDVYAYGIVLWEIISGQVPFSGLEPPQIIMQVMVNDLRPIIPESTNEPLRQLVTACWTRNPSDRPTFDEIVRILASGVTLDGADQKEFQKYVTATIGHIAASQEKIERQLNFSLSPSNPVPFPLPIQSKSSTKPGKSEERKNSSSEGKALAEMTKTLEKEGISSIAGSSTLIQKCWALVEQNSHCSPTIVGRAAALFLDPSLFVKGKASAIIRKLPPGSLSSQKSIKLLTAAVETIPTGDEEFDTDIIISACKNGLADLASIYALLPSHLKLTFEIVGQHGVDLSLKAAVADRCVQCLTKSYIITQPFGREKINKENSNDVCETKETNDWKDPTLVCAAIRCLIGIKESKRIPMATLREFINSRNKSLEWCAYAAICSLGKTGIELDLDLIDDVIERIEEEPLAFKAILSACRETGVAVHLVNRIAYGSPLKDSISLRILMLAALNKDVRPAVQIILNDMDYTKSSAFLQEGVNTLKNFVLNC